MPEDLKPMELGGMNWPMFGCYILAWILIFACLAGGVQTSGKVVYFTALFPYVVLFIVLCYGATLEGAGEGIKYYVTPKLDKLEKPDVTSILLTHIFHALL